MIFSRRFSFWCSNQGVTPPSLSRLLGPVGNFHGTRHDLWDEVVAYDVRKPEEASGSLSILRYKVKGSRTHANFERRRVLRAPCRLLEVQIA